MKWKNLNRKGIQLHLTKINLSSSDAILPCRTTLKKNADILLTDSRLLIENKHN